MKSKFRLSISKSAISILSSKANMEQAEQRMFEAFKKYDSSKVDKVVFKILIDNKKKGITSNSIEVSGKAGLDDKATEKITNELFHELCQIAKENGLYGKYFESAEYQMLQEKSEQALQAIKKMKS